MKRFRHLTAVFLVVIILIGGCFSAGIPAAAESRTDATGSLFLSDNANLGPERFAALYERIHTALTSCESEVALADFGLDYMDEQIRDAVYTLVFYEMPEAFHLTEYAGTYNTQSGLLHSLSFVYSETSATYDQKLLALRNAVNAMTKDLKNNPALTATDKILLAHDRLVTFCRYDNSPAHSHDAYGALVEGKASCLGYSGAYMMLMQQLGIDCFSCTSDSINHAWNMVRLDGALYHVDTTWDDISPDATGRVHHEYLLLSSEGLMQQRRLDGFYPKPDFCTEPHNTRFENAYWRTVRAEFILLNGTMYYIDRANARLMAVSGSEQTAVCSLSQYRWQGKNPGTYRIGCYSLLSSCEGKLLYSTPTSVIGLDPVTLTETTLFTPELPGNGYQIFGFTYRNGFLLCDITDNPINGSEDGQNTVRFPYLGESFTPDNGRLHYTVNGVGSHQTGLVTLESGQYYIENGFWMPAAETLVKQDGRWFHVSGGRVDNTELPTLCRYNGSWFYVRQGILDWDSDTLVKYGGVWFHVAGGSVRFGESPTLVKYQNTWFYVRNGQVDWTANTLVNYGGSWFYVRNGQVDWTANTLVKYGGVWFHVAGGSVRFGESPTLIKYQNAWFYVKNGQVDWNANTLVNYGGTWFYVKNGQVDWTANTLVNYGGVWFHVSGGSVNFNEETTLCKYNGTWFCVKGGLVDWNYSGWVWYLGQHFTVQSGILK